MACRTARQKRELLRVVRTPEGVLAIDPTGKRAGRGAYVCVDGECRRQAIERGTLQRALEVPLTPELRAELLELMADQGGIRGQE